MGKDTDHSKSSTPPENGIAIACHWLPDEDEKSNLSSAGGSRDSLMIVSSTLEVDQSSNLPAIIGCEKAFSSSLPALLHEKLNVENLVVNSIEETEVAAAELVEDDLIPHAIGDLLPNEEELFAGIVDGFDMMNLHNNAAEESEEFDLFSSGGGMELDGDMQDSMGSQSDGSRGGINGFSGSSVVYQGTSNGNSGCIIGEHPFGEHPSRTLFVRNINSNVEDAELRALFEHYGAIRTLYTACKHRGFVMISYYDIRSARNAMRALQNKPLRRRKLDIHFSIPKDNPSDKDVNQGTLVVFNLEASVSNEELRQIFGQYGEVKEIRETPHKRHHKFIEFYDVRAAEAALKALNRSDIAGKRIKLEPSRPGGARRSLIQQQGPDSEQDDNSLYGFSSPITLSPPGNISSWTQFASPLENSPLRTLHSALGTIAPNVDKLAPNSGSLRVGTIGSHLGRMGSIDSAFSPMPAGAKAASPYRAHSLPDQSNSSLPFSKPPVPFPVRSGEVSRSSYDVLDSLQIPRSSAFGNGDFPSVYERTSGAIKVPGGGSLQRSGSASLSGSQFLWGQSNSSSHQQSSAFSGWAGTSPISHSPHSSSHTQPRPFVYTGANGLNPASIVPPHRYQLGSAPSYDPSFLERHFGFCMESPDMSYHFGPSSLGPIGTIGNVGSPSSVLSLNVNTAHTMLNPGSLGASGVRYEGGSSPNFALPPYRRNSMFQTGASGGSDCQADRGRIRRRESNSIHLEGNRQYQLDIERILRGEDTRTTLMIKNIPNKYTSKMLLAAIDENHRRTYDFLYLPIDFKNKCNVGYAFINMTSPAHIIPLYQAFNGKKWEKFNSEKVASLAYARIQGKAALVAHFQNSSLMNEDKRCRPILFDADQPDASEQDQLTSGNSMLDVGWRESDGISEFIDELKRQSSAGEHSTRLDNFAHSSSLT
ncbi:hypothetical protein L7F22_021637 [Adiantum nelumboides]|nr:hypothetical protein [Adiantum nelumboides]